MYGYFWGIRITRQMHSDGKKLRSFVAPLFTSGDLQRYLLIAD